jgi:S1-C subfamily serine protease
MALIPPFFLNCVVSIGVPLSSPQNSLNWIGTGFIVGRPITDDAGLKKFHTFVVTNKHVLAGKPQITLRFNSLDGTRVFDYSTPLESNGEMIWVGHSSADVDVAVFNINPTVLEKDGAEFSFFYLDEHVMGVAKLKAEGVSEGDGVFVLGFPMGIVAPQRKNVIARMGALARIRDVLDGHQSSFLIDANIFPGNSGGPVVIRPDMNCIQNTKSINRAALIGIVKSYVPYKDIAISQQTGNPRVIFEENSGLALAETVDSIQATVEECFRTKVMSHD